MLLATVIIIRILICLLGNSLTDATYKECAYNLIAHDHDTPDHERLRASVG